MPTLLRSIMLVVLTALPARAEVELLMGEEAGCIWCARWNSEIAPIYPKSPEGQAAPLRRVDIHAPMPADLDLDGGLVVTPTFVLVKDGTEIDRMEGYPGEEFFWALLDRMLDGAAETTPAFQGWRDR
ncbi:hypothetical protein [uncultured Jannaschia sp.]|uniref:hypothetical protein n=1 Tax=uncultured Jannaschia sp. TaxID=293347 RepID=UPI002604A318|nr:hypothetical protein [uncultured Jannaschia sp.]